MSVDQPSVPAAEPQETKPPVKEKRSLQETMSIVAWITAVAALSLTCWQFYETRRHNKLSVTPALSINTNVSANFEFVGMTISNEGLGPGRLKLIRIYVDGQRSF